MSEGTMRRDLSVLSEKEFDLVIIGGGIFGICAAWDATLRGFRVALLEKDDFAHATSANCFKIVHGGIRYLQHADIRRVRESSYERNVLLRIAPHLVRPLPIAIPTYRHGLRGKTFLRAGLFIYDVLTLDRNRDISDPGRRIPCGKTLSRKETLDLFPGLEDNGLTGAVVFHDAQMYSPARLALAYLRAAVEKGAEAANYVSVTGFKIRDGRVVGVEAIDRLRGGKFDIRGRTVINAAGPWADWLLKDFLNLSLDPAPTFSRDVFFVVSRKVLDNCALAVLGKTKDPDAILSRGHRHLFVVPWRDSTLIGVWHVVHRSRPDDFTVDEQDLAEFIDEVNAAYPGLAITMDDVSRWHAGLVLFGQNQTGTKDLSYGKRSRLIDHAQTHGLDGLVTMIGVRYTTSRSVARQAVDLVAEKLGVETAASKTSETRIHGGQIDDFDAFLHHAQKEAPNGIGADTIEALVRNHGSEYASVLKYAAEDPSLGERLEPSSTIKAEVVHAVREEMALKLSDVVFRRTDLGSGGHPGSRALETCAELMAQELGWSRERLRDEVSEVETVFANVPRNQPGRRRTSIAESERIASNPASSMGLM